MSSKIRIEITLNVSDFFGLEDILESLKGSSNEELGLAILKTIIEDLELFPADLEWGVKISDPEMKEEKDLTSKTKSH